MIRFFIAGAIVMCISACSSSKAIADGHTTAVYKFADNFNCNASKAECIGAYNASWSKFCQEDVRNCSAANWAIFCEKERNFCMNNCISTCNEQEYSGCKEACESK